MVSNEKGVIYMGFLTDVVKNHIKAIAIGMVLFTLTLGTWYIYKLIKNK